MSLFDDDMFNDPDDLDEWFYFKLFPPYKDILGERISEKINEFTIKMKDKDERLFDVLRRELSEWLVCNGLATNDIKFEVVNTIFPDFPAKEGRVIFWYMHSSFLPRIQLISSMLLLIIE